MPILWILRLAATAALAFLIPTAEARQQLLYRFVGDDVADQLGSSVSGAGDVNGDGFRDVIFGEEWDDIGGSRTGRAWVYSGLDGSMLHDFRGTWAFGALGHSVSGAGDVNGDGFADVIVGIPRDDRPGFAAGSVEVYSGLDGSELFRFTGEQMFERHGESVSDIGDVNNDGFPDLLVGAPGGGAGGVGLVRVYCGLKGAVLFSTFGEDGSNDYGQSVSGAGDLNGDGRPDFIVGEPGNNTGGFLAGSVYVYSGATGSKLYRYRGKFGDHLGNSVSAAGDVDGDGYSDFIAGAPLAIAGGNALVYSGVDGSIQHLFVGDSTRRLLGRSVSSAGDVNNDSYTDLIVGIPWDSTRGPRSGSVQIYSGADGETLYNIYSSGGDSWFGLDVSCAGDVNQDGFPDVIIGAMRDDTGGFDSGLVEVYSGDNGSLTPAGDGCAGEGGFIPVLKILGTAVLGTPATVTLTDVQGGATAALLISSCSGSLLLGSGCTLDVGWPADAFVLLGTLPGVGPGSGSFAAGASFHFSGMFYGQALIRDSTVGLITSNGVRFEIVP